MKDSFLVKAGIVATFNENLIDFEKALRVVAASLHLDFSGVHHMCTFLSAVKAFIYKQKKSGLCLRIF